VLKLVDTDDTSLHMVHEKETANLGPLGIAEAGLLIKKDITDPQQFE
jgi:hypothetical protein